MENVQVVNIEEKLSDMVLVYSININARTFPDVRTGFKQVGTRILYMMNKRGLGPSATRKKVNTVGGYVLEIHGHGNASVEDAIYKMAQPFYNNATLIDPKGNVGTIAGDSPAAPRYVEVRLSKYGADLCEDINKNAVLWKDNYDQTEKEPRFLPVKYPNLLINGSFGIGWGFISNIPCHNFTEVCETAIDLINNPDMSVREVAERLLPDFPTGGLIINKDEVIDGYTKGEGQLAFRARLERDDDKKLIIFTEIPFMKNTGAITEKIVEKVKEGKINDIIDVNDRSKNGKVQIIVKCSKNANLSYLIQQLYQYTPLEDTMAFDFMVQSDNTFMKCNIKELLTEWIEFRKLTIQRIYNYDIEKISLRIHIIDGLLIALKDKKALIKVITESDDRTDMIKNLKIKFKDMTQLQAENISDMKTHQLTKLGVEPLQEERATKQIELDRLLNILSNDELLNDVIINELKDGIKKYGHSRMTELANLKGIDKEAVIEDKDFVIYFTKNGIVKRIDVQLENNSKSKYYGGKLSKGDFVAQRFESNSKDVILAFTNMGRVLQLRTYEIPETANITTMGIDLNAQLKLVKGERTVKLINLSKDDYETAEFYYITATKKGLIKRTESVHFRKINKGGLIAMKINNGDELADVILTTNTNKDILVVSKKGIGIRFPIEQIPNLLRSTAGATAIDLQKGDSLISIQRFRNPDMLIVTEKGVCKVLENESLTQQKRGGKGRRVIRLEENDNVVNILYVKPNNKIKIISDKGFFDNLIKHFGKAEDRSTSGRQLIPIEPDETVLTFVVE